MDNRNLYFVFLYAMYWLWEMIKDVLSLIFVLPFRIFMSACSMYTSDAIPFIKGEIYGHLNRMKVYGITLKLIVQDGKPSFSVKSYFEETQALADELNKKKFVHTKDMIEEALKTVKQCMYVTLESNTSGATFIQFHYGSGTYCFDFPLTPRTLNRDYSTDVIQYLRKRGFTKYNIVKGYAFKYKTYNIYPLEDDLTTVNANFGNDIKLAAEVSAHMFEHILHVKEIPTASFG